VSPAPTNDRVVRWHDDPWDGLDAVWSDDVEVLRRHRRGLRFVVFLPVIAVIAVAVVLAVREYSFVSLLDPPGPAGEPLRFEVVEGDTVASLGVRLEGEGLVLDANAFARYVEREGGLEPVPGFYALRPGDHAGNILAVLRTPPAETFTSVVFPEGFTVRQMARRLADNVPGIDADRFVELATTDSGLRSAYQRDGVDDLEGLLFPDTYRVAGDESEAAVIERMLRLMERVGRQEGVDESYLDPYDVLIVASMIEREAKVDDDRARIARVIYNRLFDGMPLQIDATLYYGQDPATPFPELRERDTPYNTYLYTGLPPTPIANPGRASIRAAMQPSPNPSSGDPLCAAVPAGSICKYLYYVVIDEDGRHAFAATFEQHQANIEIARERGVL
jgi:UPF0755 protein